MRWASFSRTTTRQVIETRKNRGSWINKNRRFTLRWHLHSKQLNKKVSIPFAESNKSSSRFPHLPVALSRSNSKQESQWWLAVAENRALSVQNTSSWDCANRRVPVTGDLREAHYLNHFMYWKYWAQQLKFFLFRTILRKETLRHWNHSLHGHCRSSQGGVRWGAQNILEMNFEEFSPLRS